jgi:UrcA family protein
MTTSINRSISTAFIAVALIVVASHAAAGPAPQRSLEPSVTVRFGDLNTSSVEGTRTLYARISDAARAVCDSGALWYPSVYWTSKECYRATVDQVVAKLNLPALSALHFAATHRALGTTALQARNR